MERLVKDSRNNRIQNLTKITERTESLWRQIGYKYQDSVKKSKSLTEKKDANSWTVKVSNTIKKRVHKTPEDEKTTKNRIKEARRAMVAEKNPEEPSHCTKDQATAILFPCCKMLGRCFKCQSLYNYTMHPTAKADESTDSCFSSPLNKEGWRWQCKGYPAGCCAEDLAHTFCNAINAKYPLRQAATSAK
jgi:hypothetical protein